MSQFHQNFIISVIDLYGLELDGHQVDTLIVTWLQKYDPAWIVKAIVESLYRGRYKIVSVDNILKDWQRLGKPRHNFTPEYERDILQNLPVPTYLAAMPVPIAPSVPPPNDSLLDCQPSIDHFSRTVSPTVASENLNPEESAPFGRHHHSSLMQLATHQVGSATVTKTNLEEPLEIETVDPDPAAVSWPPSPATLQVESYPDRESQIDMPAERISSDRVNHHLFATLKAIVDPNYRQAPDVDKSVCLPLYVVNSKSDRIEQFDLPLEQSIEEQYL